MNSSSKQAVSVSEMARMVGLSRSRFYQLMGTAFPDPIYSLSNRRPFFDEELQQICLEVKRRNCGIDGKPILFYSGKAPMAVGKKATKVPTQKSKPQSVPAEILGTLKGLGMTVNPSQVETAIQKLFPLGIHGMDQAEVVRALFLQLNQKK